MRDKLVIIGASGHGKVIADIAKLNGYKEIIFLDDDINKTKNGKYDVVGTGKDIDKYLDQYDYFVAIGNNDIRKQITEKLEDKKIIQPVLIHPAATVDETAKISSGTVVMANAVINADVCIKKGCIINTAASVDHDCKIEDYVHLSPGVHIAGTVSIGERTWIGAGTTVINNISIADSCVIGAGSTVIKDIEEKGVYAGVPARRIKQ